MKALKYIFAPSLNRMIKFGRRTPVAPGHKFRLRNYLRASLPAPPTSCDYSPAALKALAQMYGNDSLGDCVIAGGYHIEGVETGNAGDMFIATQAQIIKDYEAIGGYVPGDPSTDNGCDEDTATNWWEAHGFANGTKLLGAISADPASITENHAGPVPVRGLHVRREPAGCLGQPHAVQVRVRVGCRRGSRSRERALLHRVRLHQQRHLDQYLGHDRAHHLGGCGEVLRCLGRRPAPGPPHPGSVGQGPGQGSERRRLDRSHLRLRHHGRQCPSACSHPYAGPDTSCPNPDTSSPHPDTPGSYAHSAGCGFEASDRMGSGWAGATASGADQVSG